MSIGQRLNSLKNSIPQEVTLVAVSKTKPVKDIMQAYEEGQRIFGENKVQELCEKQEQLPKDIEWHLIGHLQTNKVKLVVPFVELIHSIDSFKLLKEVNKEALKADRVVKCLLQIKIAEEESKFGLSQTEASELVSGAEFKEMKNIQLCGLMGMSTFTDNKEQVIREFSSLQKYYIKLKSEYFKDNDNFMHLSMGMSGDYELAIEQGSNMIRVGSTIFGERVYN